MCQIIAKRRGIKFNPNIYENIKNIAACNQDGLGFSYRPVNRLSKGRFVCIKTVKKLGSNRVNEIIAELKKLDIGKDDELIIHARIRTNGPVTFTNTQPIMFGWGDDQTKALNKYEVNDVACAVIAHNGVMRDFSYDNKDFSDTYLFMKDFLKKKSDGDKEIIELFYEARSKMKNYDEWFEKVISKYKILADNRIVVLHPKEGLLLLGGSWFIDDHGLLYANHSGIKGRLRAYTEASQKKLLVF